MLFEGPDGKIYKTMENGQIEPLDNNNIKNNDQKLENDYGEVLKTGEIKGTMDNQPGKIIENIDQANDFIEKQHARLEQEYKKTEQYRNALTFGIVSCGIATAVGITAWKILHEYFEQRKTAKYFIAAGTIVAGIGLVVCAGLRGLDPKIRKIESAKNKLAESKVDAYTDTSMDIGSGAREYAEGYKVGASFTPKHTELQKQFHSAKLAGYFSQARKELGDDELTVESSRSTKLYNNNAINKTHYNII